MSAGIAANSKAAEENARNAPTLSRFTVHRGRGILAIAEISLGQDKRNVVFAVGLAVTHGHSLFIVEAVIDFDVELVRGCVGQNGGTEVASQNRATPQARSERETTHGPPPPELRRQTAPPKRTYALFLLLSFRFFVNPSVSTPAGRIARFG